jgi:hypothetical protein
MSDEEWACLEPFVIEPARGVVGAREITALFWRVRGERRLGA